MNQQCPVCSASITAAQESCPECGFKLFGSTQSFSPIAMNEDPLVVEEDIPLKTAFLRIVRGAQLQKTFQLEGGSYTVGRNPQCDIFLNDMTVSRDHASIESTNEGYRINDEHSFNGVWVNNNNVEHTILHDGDIVQIGAFCLLYKENTQN